MGLGVHLVRLELLELEQGFKWVQVSYLSLCTRNDGKWRTDVGLAREGESRDHRVYDYIEFECGR